MRNAPEREHYLLEKDYASSGFTSSEVPVLVPDVWPISFYLGQQADSSASLHRHRNGPVSLTQNPDPTLPVLTEVGHGSDTK